MIDLSQLTSKTAISGYVVAAALPVALTAGDRMTQVIACAIAILGLVALGVFAPDTKRTITTGQIAKLGENDPHAPITPAQLVKTDPMAATKVDPPHRDGFDPLS